MRRYVLNSRVVALCFLISLLLSGTQASIVHRHGRLKHGHHHLHASQQAQANKFGTVDLISHQRVTRDANRVSFNTDTAAHGIDRIRHLLPELKDDLSDFLKSVKALINRIEGLIGDVSSLGTATATTVRINGTTTAERVPEATPGPLQSTVHGAATSPLPLTNTRTLTVFTVTNSGSSEVHTSPFRVLSESSDTCLTPDTKTQQYSNSGVLTGASRLIPSSQLATSSELHPFGTTTISIKSTLTITRTTTRTTSMPASRSLSIPVQSRSTAATSSPVASGFNPEATNNIAVYYGQTPPTTANGLLTLCANPSISIVNLAFLATFFGPNGYPSTAFGPACYSTQNSLQSSTAPGLQNCSYLGQQISTCQQQYGKKIFVSLGGYIASSSFPSASAAAAFATTLWNLFGAGNGTGNPTTTSPSQNAQLRPFGPNVTVDGFDVDNEDNIPAYWPDFAIALRTHYLSPEAVNTGKDFYLSSTPQCPRPDASIPLDVLLLSDFVNVQFYNNPECNVGAGPGFFDSVVAWAGDLTNITSASGNFDSGSATEARRPGGLGSLLGKHPKKVIPQTGYGLRTAGVPTPKLFIGVPAWPGGAGSGYVPGASLVGIMNRVKRRLARVGMSSALGGVMMWDGTEALLNVDSQGDNFVDDVAAALE